LQRPRRAVKVAASLVRPFAAEQKTATPTASTATTMPSVVALQELKV